MTGDSKAREERARAEAVAWQVRLASELANDADWLALEAWLDADPLNAAAFERVERVWSAFEDPAVPARPGARARPFANALGWSGALLAASLALVALVWAFNRSGDPPAETQLYATAKGATRQIALADGSRVRLNSGSRISVRMSSRERRVRLLDGEAAFEVAKNARRPFFVEAADREVRVVGTEFDVLSYGGLTRVAVRRGIVAVRSADGAATAATLVAGQVLEHRQGAMQDLILTTSPEGAFAWTEGRLVYENRRLDEVAADLNRYLAVPIVVAPDARDLRLTAVMSLESEETILSHLTAFLPLRAQRQGDVVRLSRRAGPR